MGDDVQEEVAPVPEEERQLLSEGLLDLRWGVDVGPDELLSQDDAHVPVAHA